MQLRLIANLLDSHNFPLWLIYWRIKVQLQTVEKKKKETEIRKEVPAIFPV